MASCKGSKNFDYLLGNSTTTTKKNGSIQGFISCLTMDPSCQLNSSIQGLKYKQLVILLSACKPWANP